MSNPRHGKFVVGAFYENTVTPPLGALCVYVTLSGAAHFVVRTGDDDSSSSDGPGPIYQLVDWFSDAKSRPDWKEVWPVPETAIQVTPNPGADHAVKRWDSSGTLVWEHPKTKGWYLPTRYHETPGRYEDEHAEIWVFRADAGRPCLWLHVASSTWSMSPHAPLGHPNSDIIAVRWVGECDD